MSPSDPSPETQPELRVTSVCQRFGDVVALHDVSFSIDAGKIGVLIGGSGAGKTTLLRIVIGLDRPSSGSVFVDGEDITRLRERQLQVVRRKFGMVFQQAALLDSMTVLDNVALPLIEHTRLTKQQRRERVRAKLDALELGPIEDRLPSQLSGGMRKRVGIARALILDPKILLYDEPTSGLDPITARLVDQLIVKTRDRFGVTSLIISHDMAEAKSIADELFVLNKGELDSHGSVAELRHRPGGLAARFFESSLIQE